MAHLYSRNTILLTPYSLTFCPESATQVHRVLSRFSLTPKKAPLTDEHGDKGDAIPESESDVFPASQPAGVKPPRITIVDYQEKSERVV